MAIDGAGHETLEAHAAAIAASLSLAPRQVATLVAELRNALGPMALDEGTDTTAQLVRRSFERLHALADALAESVEPERARLYMLPSTREVIAARAWLQAGAPAAAKGPDPRLAVRALLALIEALPGYFPKYCYGTPEHRAEMEGE